MAGPCSSLCDVRAPRFALGLFPSPFALRFHGALGKGTRSWSTRSPVREDTLLDLFSPHSDQMTVGERIRLTSPGTLEDRLTTTEPKALLEPFVQVQTYRKAAPPNDELREFSCAEGLTSAK